MLPDNILFSTLYSAFICLSITLCYVDLTISQIQQVNQICKMTYTLIQQFSTQHVHLTFNGPFQGEIVTWDAHFSTLEDYKEKKKKTSQNLKQFIEIEPIDSKNMKLTVSLNVKAITEPNIQKMMIMIKQYKNLSLGRHEFG